MAGWVPYSGTGLVPLPSSAFFSFWYWTDGRPDSPAFRTTVYEGGKGYTLRVYTAGGVHGCILHVHTAGGVDGYTLQSYLLAVKTDTACTVYTQHVHLTVERDTPCTFTRCRWIHPSRPHCWRYRWIRPAVWPAGREDRYSLHVHSADDGKGYILHVHSVGGGES